MSGTAFRIATLKRSWKKEGVNVDLRSQPQMRLSEISVFNRSSNRRAILPHEIHYIFTGFTGFGG
jgi:hypothetical protein